MREIVGIGACVFDTLISLPHYPKEDTKLRADNVKSAGGGPAATGLVAAAKLGVSTAYIGNLSNDMGGKYLFSDFEKYGGREKFDNADIAIFDRRTQFELQPFSAQIYEVL